MKAKFAHFNFNVLDLKKSMEFYEEALGLKEVKRVEKPDFTLVYLGDGETDFQLELTYLHDRTEKYDLGKLNSTLRLRWRISRRRTPAMKRWAAFAMKTRIWGSIL